MINFSDTNIQVAFISGGFSWASTIVAAIVAQVISQEILNRKKLKKYLSIAVEDIESKKWAIAVELISLKFRLNFCLFADRICRYPIYCAMPLNGNCFGPVGINWMISPLSQ